MMKSKTRQFLAAMAVAVGLGVAVAPLAAHHSFTMFDFNKPVTLTGTVKEFQWTNPHTFTWVEVTGDDGKVALWGLEGMSPNYLGRRGWSKNTLKPGDKISVDIYPLKDGQNGGTFLRCRLDGGKEMVMFANPSPNGPAKQ